MINNAVNNRISGKRLLIYDSDLPNKKVADRKVHSLMEDRKSQNME